MALVHCNVLLIPKFNSPFFFIYLTVLYSNNHNMHFLDYYYYYHMSRSNEFMQLQFIQKHWLIYSCFEKGCRKKCMRQSRKVLWVVFSSLFLKEISKNGRRGHGHMFASAKGKQQKQVRQLQCQEQVIDHIPYYLSPLSRAQFLRQPFSKQLYTTVHVLTFSLFFFFSFAKVVINHY